jgi:hypothetical protein
MLSCSHSSRACSKVVHGEECSYSLGSSTSPSYQTALGHLIPIVLSIINVSIKLHAITDHGANPLWANIPIRQFCEGVIVALCGLEPLEKYCMMIWIMPPKAGACGGHRISRAKLRNALRPDLELSDSQSSKAVLGDGG